MNTENSSTINSFLSFRLNDEEFATNVASVLSILEMPKITKIPRAPEYIRGIINLRGEVLPVIDIHNKFGLPQPEITSSTCILVMEATLDNQYIKFGILVDSVNEVHQIEPEKILPEPKIGSKYNSIFIDGVYQTGETFIIIVDIKGALLNNEIEGITTTRTHNITVESVD
jgi:purine-binding chemotaxis protein CheW